MKLRFKYLVSLYVLTVFVFIIQKILFMFATAPGGCGAYGCADFMHVVWHGLQLDIPMTGYLVIVPLLAVIASCWTPSGMMLRRWMVPYYAVVAVMTGLVFVSDMSLYPFWKFKLDATIFYYMDSPADAMASVSAGYIALRVVMTAVYAVVLFVGMRCVTPVVLHPLPGVRERIVSTVALVVLSLIHI